MTPSPFYRWTYDVRRYGLLVTTGELALLTPHRAVAELRVAEHYARLNPTGAADGHETQITERHRPELVRCCT